MTILISDNDYMFDVFETQGRFYMTATTGGVGQYDMTLQLTKEDVESFLADKNKAIATSRDFVTRPDAYEGRIIVPSIDPV